MAQKTLQYTTTGAQGAVSGTVWTATPLPVNFSLNSPNANPATLTYPDYYNYFTSNSGITGQLGYTAVSIGVTMQDTVCPASAPAQSIYFACKLSSASLDTTATTQSSGTIIYTATPGGSPAFPHYIFNVPSGNVGFTFGANLPANNQYSINLVTGYEFSTTNNGGTAYNLSVEITDRGVSGGTNSPCIVTSPIKTFYIKAPAVCTLSATITIS